MADFSVTNHTKTTKSGLFSNVCQARKTLHYPDWSEGFKQPKGDLEKTQITGYKIKAI